MLRPHKPSLLVRARFWLFERRSWRLHASVWPAYALAAALVLFAACAPGGSSDAGAPPAPAPARATAPTLLDEPAPTSPPPPKVDSRTPQQIALAACAGADGSWRCPKIARPMRASASQGPIIPPSWTVPAWYQDGGNSTGCASDANSCTSGTCGTGGVGPCLTLNEIRVHRWGGVPQLQQTTTINLLSSESVGQENVPLSVATAGPYQFIVQGTRTLVTTLTPASLTAMNRATPQLLQIGVSSAAGLAAGQLVVDNTRSNSRATVENVNGTTITLSQPFNAQTLSSCGRGSHCAPVEDNGWAVTDSLSFYTYPVANLTAFDLRGGIDSASPWPNGVAILQYVQIPDQATVPGATLFAPTSADGFIVLLDDYIAPSLLLQGPIAGAFNEIFARAVNLYTSAFALSNAEIDGGVVTSTAISSIVQVGGVVDGDIVLLNGLQSFSGRNDVSNLYVPTGKNLLLSSGSNMNWRAGINGEWIWGGGGINVRSGASFSDGATASYVSNFLLTGGMTFDANVTTCSYYASGTWTSGAALNQSTIDAHGGCMNPQSGAIFTTVQ